MEKRVFYNREELYSLPHERMNTAYNNKRKIHNAAPAFGLGQNEELEVEVRPEINEQGEPVWNVDLSVKQYYQANTLLDMITSEE